MKAKDLRLGNLVLEFGQEVVVDIPLLQTLLDHKDGDEIFHSGKIISRKDLIELGFTEDIEVCWGVGHSRHYSIFKRGHFTYNSIQATWWFNNSVMPLQPEYVHQLQNMFFAMEGVELTKI